MVMIDDYSYVSTQVLARTSVHQQVYVRLCVVEAWACFCFVVAFVLVGVALVLFKVNAAVIALCFLVALFPGTAFIVALIKAHKSTAKLRAMTAELNNRSGI